MRRVTIYTDGAYHGHIDIGGAAAILCCDEKQIEISKAYKGTTNNRMEIYGAILAFERLKNPAEVTLIADSMYLLQTVAGNYRKLKNIDLWERMDMLTSFHKINCKWVKGHSGDPYNEKCDQMAEAAIRYKTDLTTDFFHREEGMKLNSIPKNALQYKDIIPKASQLF